MFNSALLKAQSLFQTTWTKHVFGNFTSLWKTNIVCEFDPNFDRFGSLLDIHLSLRLTRCYMGWWLMSFWICSCFCCNIVLGNYQKLLCFEFFKNNTLLANEKFFLIQFVLISRKYDDYVPVIPTFRSRIDVVRQTDYISYRLWSRKSETPLSKTELLFYLLWFVLCTETELSLVLLFSYWLTQLTGKFDPPCVLARQFEYSGQLPRQSCKSGRAFRVGFGFGPGSGLKLTKISGLIRAWDVLFVLGVQKIIKITWQYC